MEHEALKVLVVDNASLMCDFVNSILSRIKYINVIRANHYHTACDILANEGVDLLLTELNLEAQAHLGLELIGRLRSDDFEQTAYDIPIIVCSSDAKRQYVKEAACFDVSDFLVKPVSALVVKNKVLRYLMRPKQVKQLAYYDQLQQKLLDIYQSKPSENDALNAWVMLPPKEEEQDAYPSDEVDDGLYEMAQFISWPEETSTGNFVIDKHLKRFAFHVNGLHFAVTHQRRLTVLEKERENVVNAMTYLEQVVGRTYVERHQDVFYQKMMERLDKLAQIKTELSAVEIIQHRRLTRLLRKISHWWMATCSRSLIAKASTGNRQFPSNSAKAREGAYVLFALLCDGATHSDFPSSVSQLLYDTAQQISMLAC